MSQVLTQAPSQRQRLILVALYLEYDLAVPDVKEPNPRIVGRHHGDIRVEELDASHFAAACKLAAPVAAAD